MTLQLDTRQPEKPVGVLHQQSPNFASFGAHRRDRLKTSFIEKPPLKPALASAVDVLLDVGAT